MYVSPVRRWSEWIEAGRSTAQIDYQKTNAYSDTVWRPVTAPGDLKPLRGSGFGFGLGLGVVGQAGLERRGILKSATSNLQEIFDLIVLHF